MFYRRFRKENHFENWFEGNFSEMKDEKFSNKNVGITQTKKKFKSRRGNKIKT